MLDINKTRNNFQNLTLMQKCDTVVIKQTNQKTTTKLSSTTKINTPSTTATTLKGKQPQRLEENPSVKERITKFTELKKELLQQQQSLSTKPIAPTATTRPTTSNPVREANQPFFLYPAYKDQNFLKEECELAQAQVTSAISSTERQHRRRDTAASALPNVVTINGGGGRTSLVAGRSEDSRNNNNNSNINNYRSAGSGIGTTRITTTAAAALFNGMRRTTDNGSYLATASSSAAATNSTKSTSNSADSVHKIEIVFNNHQQQTTSKAPQLPKAQHKSITPITTESTTTTVPSTLLGNSKSTSTAGGGARQLLKTTHRTIPVTAHTAAVNSFNNRLNNNNNNSLNSSITNNNNNNSSHNNGVASNHIASGNNNMPHQPHSSRNSLLEQHDDDIKYIDSDDASLERKPTIQCEQSSAFNNKTRSRPKSTIIMTNQNVFEKINSYNYANGCVNNATTTSTTSGGVGSGISSAVPVNNISTGTTTTSASRRHEFRSSGGGGGGGGSLIDSSSIKASIEKFNSFSQQKPLPFNSVTLRSHSGGGSTSNLQHHRHSSDFDHCNVRLPPTSGGSLTRTPYRTTSASKVITSIHPAVTALPTVISSSAAGRSMTASPSSSGSISGSSTNSLPGKSSNAAGPSSSGRHNNELYMSRRETADTKKQQNVDNKSASTAASCSGASAFDDSVRTSTTARSVLPPQSPTSRYWDRDSSKTSSLTLSSYNSTDETKKSSSDEKSEGLCGLRNIGNTCFMNSVIQCLSHTNELTKFLRSQSAVRTATTLSSSSSSPKDQQILNEFAKLIRDMWTNNMHSVTPMDLKRAFSSKHRMYSDYNQQDAQEFLRFFLDTLHSALNSGVKGEHLKIDDNLSDNKKADLTWDWYTRHENSLIRDLFVGQLKSTLKCTTCGNTSVTFDPFWDLSVSLPSSSRCKLDACLDLFIREEVLDGDEMPTCSKCQTRRKCTKSFTIQRFPRYLVIHLKRFSETRWSKLTNIVEFPTGERELNMGAYGSNPNTNIYYSLYAISNHMGSTAGGHYVALCKHPMSRKWHEFNDNIVSDSLTDHHLVSSSAYILFYERA